MLLVVLPVIFMTLWFSWRYRDSNTNIDYQPEWSHSTLLEIIWWTIPCMIVSILAVITWVSCHQLDPFKSLNQTTTKSATLKIRVIALDWKWLFIYPQQNIATVNYLAIPVGTPVEFEITSEGPMNSFVIPQLAGQIYAMAGMRSKLNLIANDLGDYKGFSANFSGNGFSNMQFVTHVATQKEFNDWIETTKHASKSLDRTEYNRLAQASTNEPVMYYRATDKYIFINTVMKKMMPEKDVLALCRERSWV